MRKFISAGITLLYLTICLYGQKEETVTVKAGTKLLDYFTVRERYLYPGFTTGNILLWNGITSAKQLNYNIPAGEMEFIDRSDTLSIANKRDIKMITLAGDTFFYDKGYLQQIRGIYPKVGIKQFYELKEIQSKDSYGVAGSGGSVTSYSSLPADGSFYKLTANKDMVFKKTVQYYISAGNSDFQPYNKKNVYKLFPGSKARLNSFLKAGKFKFNSRDDLLRLAGFLATL